MTDMRMIYLFHHHFTKMYECSYFQDWNIEFTCYSSGVKMSGVKMSGKNVRGKNIRGKNVKGKMSEVKMSEVIMSEAKMSEVKMSEVKKHLKARYRLNIGNGCILGLSKKNNKGLSAVIISALLYFLPSLTFIYIPFGPNFWFFFCPIFSEGKRGGRGGGGGGLLSPPACTPRPFIAQYIALNLNLKTHGHILNLAGIILWGKGIQTCSKINGKRGLHGDQGGGGWKGPTYVDFKHLPQIHPYTVKVTM